MQGARSGNLEKAFDQLLRYSIALESPPLLIVSDMERIRIHTNWTNTVQQVHEIALDDLADAAKRDLLRACFEDPERFRPSGARQMLTEEAARREVAALAQRLRNRGNDGHEVAHFVIRLVFCMFAEELVGLLPNTMFTRMLEASRADPRCRRAQTLFGAMKSGGIVGFEKVNRSMSGLFNNNTAIPLEAADVENLLAAARLDWSEIDPSILGTLFERGLDPDKHQLLRRALHRSR